MHGKHQKKTLGDILPKSTLEEVIDFEDEDEATAYYERDIDNRIERLEAQIGKTLTKDEREGLLEIVDELSKKDKEGDIIDYVPFGTAWQVYQSMRKRDSK